MLVCNSASITKLIKLKKNMGTGCSTLSVPNNNLTLFHSLSSTLPSPIKKPNFNSNYFIKFPIFSIHSHLSNPSNIITMSQSSLPPLSSSTNFALNSSKFDSLDTQQIISEKPMFNPHDIDPKLVQKMLYDALVWSSLHGLLVADRAVQKSGTVPGVGMVHAPFSLLPVSFPEDHFKQACELAPIFNELFDRVSLDAKFLQDSLSRTRKVDEFTSRLLDIHSKMIDMNKKEEIRLGLHRSDYMLDAQTKSLLQIEFNTISSSFSGLTCLVSELHRNLLSYYGGLQLDSRKVPENHAVLQFAKALAEAWREYNNPRAVVLVVVQAEERNMYDQHWLSAVLRERHGVTSIRKSLTEIHAEGELSPDGTLLVGGEAVAVVYYRAGYAPTDYPSDLEWEARLLVEQSSAVKSPSIAYHLAGTKKIQQELAKPNVLERFLDNKEDIAKVQRCFAGLWSLDDTSIVSDAIAKPEIYVMKPQREGGGNNIYGNDVREALLRIQKGGSKEDAAYILMQRIFPTSFPALLVREGICHKDHAISELGIYGAYLRNKEKIVMNEQCGYLMRTKVSSSDEGGVAAGFAVLDSLYLS